MRYSKLNFFLPLITVSCNHSPKTLSLKNEQTEDDLSIQNYIQDVIYVLKNKNISEAIEFPADYEVKILSLAPEDVSRINITQNFFSIKNYKSSNHFNSTLADSYAYLLKNGNKIILFSEYLGNFIYGKQQDKYFYPTKIYFQLQDGNYESIKVEYDDIWTKYIYKNSVIYVNNEDATKNPFDLTRSHVDIEEFAIFTQKLAKTTALQFIKYFFDFIAYKQGIKVSYFDKKYFSVEFNNLGNYYISSADDQATIEKKLRKMKQVVLDSEENGKNLYCTKLYVDFPFENLEAIKHVILLVRYNDKFFIIDSNAEQNSSYLGKKFTKAINNLGIHFSRNGFFQQSEGNCDTCASIMEVLLSDYWKSNNYTLPLKNNDINYPALINHMKRHSLSKSVNPAVKRFFSDPNKVLFY